jgi:HSP20 family protein
MWNDWKLGGTLLRHSAKPNLRRAHSFYDAPQAEQVSPARPEPAQVTSPSQTDAMPKNNANEMLDMKNAILTNDRNQLLPSSASLPAATHLDPDCQWFPALDVIRTSEDYLIEVDLPGLDPKDIQVTAEEGILSLRGARPPLLRGGRNMRVERPSGPFIRRLALPDDAQFAAMTTFFHNGVMELRIPRPSTAEDCRDLPLRPHE